MSLFDRRFLLVLVVAVLSGAAAIDAPAAERAWSYGGSSGPDKWAKLNKNFSLCAEGTAQSPVDIPDATVRKGDFPSMLFHYQPSPLSVMDDGHMLSLKFAPGGSMTLDSARYDLVSLEFHKPAEHRVNGKQHAMAVQLVHKTQDGKFAIIAVPVDQGKENRLAKLVLANLPTEKGTDKVVESVKLSAMDLLPNYKEYYAYMGSDTSPPCAENVEWFVLKSPITFSADQIARFAKLYPMNARPAQPVSGRDIRGSR